jgi:hypothetical protein
MTTPDTPPTKTKIVIFMFQAIKRVILDIKKNPKYLDNLYQDFIYVGHKDRRAYLHYDFVDYPGIYKEFQSILIIELKKRRIYVLDKDELDIYIQKVRGKYETFSETDEAPLTKPGVSPKKAVAFIKLMMSYIYHETKVNGYYINCCTAAVGLEVEKNKPESKEIVKYGFETSWLPLDPVSA